MDRFHVLAFNFPDRLPRPNLNLSQICNKFSRLLILNAEIKESCRLLNGSHRRIFFEALKAIADPEIKRHYFTVRVELRVIIGIGDEHEAELDATSENGPLHVRIPYALSGL